MQYSYSRRNLFFAVCFGILSLPQFLNAQQLRFNYPYACNRERVVVVRCRKESDMPGYPATRPEEDYCHVDFPDRPLRGGITPFAAVLRSDLIKQLQACGAFNEKPGSSQERASPASSSNVTEADAAAYWGFQRYKDKDYERALFLYRKALSLEPDHALAIRGIAQVNEDQKNWPEVVVARKRLAALQPSDTANLNLLGDAQRMVKLFAEAVATYQRSLQLEKSAITYYRLGLAYNDWEKYELAVPAFNEALRLQPGHSNAHYNLGLSYFKLKQYPKAIEGFEASLRAGVDGKEYVYAWIGDAYCDQKLWEKAIPPYKEAVRLKPDYDYALNRLGVAYYLTKRYPEALPVYLAAARLKPNEPRYMVNVADTYHMLGRKADALEWQKRLDPLDKKLAQELLGRINGTASTAGPPAPTGPAEDLFKAGEYARAIPEFQKIVAQNPGKEQTVKALSKMGICYRNLNQWEKALAAFAEAVRVDPAADEEYQNLGDMYEKTMQFPKALAAYREAMRLNPGSAGNQWFLGRGYVLTGNRPAAIQIYNSLLKTDAKYAGYLKADIDAGPAGMMADSAGMELVSNNREGALILIGHALKLSPDIKALNAIGGVYFELERYEDSITVDRKILTMNPGIKERAKAHSSIGFAYELLGQHDKALPEYLEAKRLEPNAFNHRSVGVAYFRLKQPEKALTEFVEAVRLDPKSADNQLFLGTTYSSLGHFDKAIGPLEEATKLDPKKAKPFEELGYALMGLKRYPEAVAVLNRGLAIEPKRANTLFLLGSTFARMGNKPQAMRVHAALRTLDAKLSQQLLAEIEKP